AEDRLKDLDGARFVVHHLIQNGEEGWVERWPGKRRLSRPGPLPESMSHLVVFHGVDAAMIEEGAAASLREIKEPDRQRGAEDHDRSAPAGAHSFQHPAREEGIYGPDSCPAGEGIQAARILCPGLSGPGGRGAGRRATDRGQKEV